MARYFPFARSLFRLFVTLLLACGGVQAATLDALPDTTMSGSEIIARGDGYRASELIEFQLVDVADGTPTPAGELFASDDGRLFGRLEVPSLEPGSYRLRARARGLVLGSAPLELVAGPSLSLSPVIGPPGRVVNASFGPIGGGRVTVYYDDIPVLGPIVQSGGSFQASFQVPSDRPVPLGSAVDVRAELSVGGSIAAAAATTFQSLPEVDDEVVLTQFSGPGQPLSPGETFSFSGRVQVPSFRSPSDYQWTFAMKDVNGALVPVNLQPILVAPNGEFSGEAVAPGIASGFGLVEFPPTVEGGLVYKIPGAGNSTFLEAVMIEYEPFEVQNLAFSVTRADNNAPIETAVVNVFSNTLFVSPGYDFEEDGIPDIRAPGTTLQKPTWSAMFAPPNQYDDAVQAISQSIAAHTNDITGCPVTLVSGLTNSAGLWQTNAVPFINWLLDKGAQKVSKSDINTSVNGPGKATFSVMLGAAHLGLGEINNIGVCTGQRFDFQYDYDTGIWNLRSKSTGDFDEPFNPDVPFPVELGVCPPDSAGIPTNPYMPGLPAKEVALFNSDEIKGPRFGAIWSFPDTNGATLLTEQVAQVRLPHLPSVFGLLQNPRLFINGTEIGPLVAEGAACGASGVEYVIELPQLSTYPPGIHLAWIEADSWLDGQSVPSKFFQLDVRQGPTWINQAGDYDSRSIRWSPKKVVLIADEPQREEVVNTGNPGYGIGPMANNNVADASVTQLLLASGAGNRKRIGNAASVAVGEDNDPVDSTANGAGSSPGNPIPFGSMDPITVLDTGKIPLFRYAWGIPPIAAATVGADVWFKALYAYFGETVMTSSQVLVDVTTEAIAQAGLDLWVDVSVILDLVSVSAYALPNFELTMPLVVKANQFDSQASQPCFDFALDVAWEVSVGWCDLCIKAGDTTNLFEILEGAGCPSRVARAPRAVPDIPPIDRTSLAVDGFGTASLAWGDGSGALQFQSYQNGIPNGLQSLTAGPGAMGADHAYFDNGKAVLVWAQSALTEAQFMALDGNPNDPLDGDFASATSAQHLVYRVDDGSGWSTPMTLTPASGGDGGVVLAACPATDPACPAGGEVLAVWVHDAAGNINLHELKLKYAFFDGLNWGPVQDVDPASTAKDLQPTATYLDGDPVVFWIRNPSVTDDGIVADFDLNQRRIAYRFLRQAAGVKEPAGLPLGVASPSVQPFLSDALALAFSTATEAEAFIGTRRSLHTAYATQCFAGVCQIGSSNERTDDQGRRIYVERPKLSRNQNGQGVVTFRQLGVDNPTANDPFGVLSHSGALMQLIYDFTPQTPPELVDPFELSNLGGVNWRVDAVFDPASNAVLTSAVQVEQTAAFARSTKRGAVVGVNERRIATGGATLVMVERPMLPEFELLAASLTPEWIPAGGSATLDVRLRNNGPAWSGAEPLTVATNWDGPPGLGLAGPSRTVDDLPTGQPLEISFSVPLPDEFHPDAEHTLHVVVNPQGALAESDGSNNAKSVSVGALPPPTDLVNIDGDASGNIIIHWEAVDDPRVTGYRVYRRNPDGSILNVGVSAVAGFADFSAYPEQRYEYFVTSHTARLAESAPSEPVDAWTLDPDQLFRDDFE